MTCIDDNANSHLGVSDGASSEQKALTAKAGPGLVRMLPGDEERWGVSSLVASPCHHWAQWYLNGIPELEAVSEHDPYPPSFSEEGY